NVGTAQILVQISGDSSASRSPVVVEWHVVGGTATSGIDYTLSSTGYVAFSYQGSIITNIDVPIINDTQVEPTETVIISLFDPNFYVTNKVVVTNGMTTTTNEVVTKFPTNAFLGSFRTHTLSIVDDDLSVVSLQVLDPEAREAGQKPATFVLSRTGNTNNPQTVVFAVGGTATMGSD